MRTDDGGPAFPVPDDRDPVTGAGIREGAPGMTLRDWFAGQVLSGAAALPRSSDYSIRARKAYEQADAMLAARKGNP